MNLSPIIGCLVLVLSAQEPPSDDLRMQPAWKKAAALAAKVREAPGIPAELRKSLETDYAGLEQERAGLQPEWTRMLPLRQKLQKEFQDQKQDGTDQARGVQAHAMLGKHACPCAEFERLKIWQGRVDGQAIVLEQRQKAFNDEFNPLMEGVLTLFESGVTPFAEDAGRALAHAATIAQARAALEKSLEGLRRDVQQTQAALKRLQTSITQGNAELEAWTKASQEASRESLERAGFFAAEGLQTYLELSRKARLEDVDGAITKVRRRIKPKKPAAELHAELRRLRDQKKVLESDETWLELIGHARSSTELFMTLNKESSDREKKLETAYSKLTELIGRKEFQALFKVNSQLAVYASLSKTIVDSAYDVTVQGFAVARVFQMEKNSDAYLKAVERLSTHLEGKVKEIVRLKELLAAP